MGLFDKFKLSYCPICKKAIQHRKGHWAHKRDGEVYCNNCWWKVYQNDEISGKNTQKFTGRSLGKEITCSICGGFLNNYKWYHGYRYGRKSRDIFASGGPNSLIVRVCDNCYSKIGETKINEKYLKEGWTL